MPEARGAYARPPRIGRVFVYRWGSTLPVTLIEPDVALTDFALAAECAVFAGWLCRGAADSGPLRRWFIVLFAALCLGSLLGGITHGFFGPAQTDVSRALWIATLASIAIAALACWGIGAHLLLPETYAKRVVALAALLLVVNLATVLFVSQAFAVAIAFYAPAVVFVLVGLVVAYARSGKSHLFPGIIGVVLSLVAAAIQQTHMEAFGLTHNALYHVVQALALLLIFLTARVLGTSSVSAVR